MGALDERAPSAGTDNDGQSLELNYYAYLIRIWRDSQHAPWRASVTHVISGDVHRFADPQLAWAHILAQLEAQPSPE